VPCAGVSGEMQAGENHIRSRSLFSFPPSACDCPMSVLLNILAFLVGMGYRGIMEHIWHIYTLTDPRTNKVRYVGRAGNPAHRLRQHLNRARSGYTQTHRDCWLNGLRTAGLLPILAVVETGHGDWQEAEMRWIAFYRQQGATLTNLTNGGEGCVGYSPSEMTREKIAMALRNRKPGNRTKQPRIENGNNLWRCSTCGSWLPATDYYSDKRSASGLKNQCKKCHQTMAVATRDKEAHRRRNREWMRRIRSVTSDRWRK